MQTNVARWPAIQSLNRHKEKRRLKELPGVLSAGQIAVPPGGSPRYLPAATPGKLFWASFFSPKSKNCYKKRERYGKK
jgi:hypothetical protein